MKTLLLFLLAFPAWANHAPDISRVRVNENTMVVSGSDLWKVQRATLGGQVVKTTMGGVDLIIYCRKLDKAPCQAGRWIPGNYSLKLFKAGKVKPLVSYPVTITGLEQQERPELPPVIMPQPAGGH